MNAFAVAGILFVATPSIIAGPLLLARGRKKIHILWAAFLSAVALWGIGMFKIGTATNQIDSIFWWKIAEVGVIFIPVFLTHFVISFLKLKRRLLLVLFYTATTVFLCADLFTDYFVRDLYFAFNQFYYILATPLYTAFICIFVASVIYVIFELSRAYRGSTSIIRNQIKYLILAFAIGFSGGVTSYPPIYRINVYPVWNATIFISVLMVGYAILRYRLMDIRIVVRKTVIYLSSAAFAYGAFFFLVWLFNLYFGGVFNSSAYLSGLILAPLFVVLLLKLYSTVQRTANKYLFYSLYSHQETISKLTNELTDSIDLGKIIDSIVNSIKQSMQLNRAGILLIDQDGEVIKYKIAKKIGFNENNGISLVQDNFLTRYLEKTQKPLVRDEIQMISRDSTDGAEKKKLDIFFENMKHIEASLCLPMIISGKLIGIIVLGSKISEDAYTNEDLELLDTLSKQAAVAIDNARLYKEVQDFSKNLQHKVDEQTQEIKKSYEAEKKYRERIDSIRVEDEALLANIGDGVIAVDKEGKVTFMNRAAEDMLMIKPESIINKPYNEVLLMQDEKGEPVPKEKSRFFSALASGKKTAVDLSGSADSIYYYVRGDKTRFPAAETVAPVVLLGNIIGAVDVFRDITVEKEIDKSKSEFVSLASHQLRTPLSVIKWYVEILLKGKTGKVSPKQKKFLKEIKTGNERVINLVNVLLNISRLEAGKLKINATDVDIKKEVQDIIKGCNLDIKKKKQKLTFEALGDLSKIKTDIDLAKIVLQNIISNAVKYTPPGGTITCKIRGRNKKILLEVKDTGIGIPKEQQGKIFEKLFRASNAFSHDPEGNGLGLYTAKKVIERLGGHIRFESKEGQGTTFFLEFCNEPEETASKVE